MVALKVGPDFDKVDSNSNDQNEIRSRTDLSVNIFGSTHASHQSFGFYNLARSSLLMLAGSMMLSLFRVVMLEIMITLNTSLVTRDYPLPNVSRSLVQQGRSFVLNTVYSHLKMTDS